MTDLDPVVRARELAAAPPNRLPVARGAEALALVPVLCDIIDQLRTKVENSERDTAEIFEHNTTLYTQKRALEELNARLTAALREVTEELSQWGMGDMHYGSIGQEKRVAEPVTRARALLAELSEGNQHE